MVKCPRCKKEVSELDEKCKYCGLDFEKYEQRVVKQEDTIEGNEGYVTGYNVLLWIFAILIFIAGLIIGQGETNIIFTCWIAGVIFIIILNMLKNIIEELRILNSKVK